MSAFTQCPACESEYRDPAHRRFHAEPNACPACGPRLWLADASGTELVQGDVIVAALGAVQRGEIVAIKGLGGFHLACDARNGEAVARLRSRKQREEKPFALMLAGTESAREFVHVGEDERPLLDSPERPIVLLEKRPGADEMLPGVAPGLAWLGVMLPYTPLHHLLLAELDFPVVATSGNLSDEPICTDEWEAMERLGAIADAFLIHNRPIARHADDSVLWLVDGAPQMLRRARGYAPLPVHVAQPLPIILGVGAHLKNTVALSIGQDVVVSQHIGDLETPQATDAFERVVADFLRMYEAVPVAVAHDLHPDYASTQWAADWSRKSAVPAIGVQHHPAHLAACLADNGCTGPAPGVPWAGNGSGQDGTAWGGAFLAGGAPGGPRAGLGP